MMVDDTSSKGYIMVTFLLRDSGQIRKVHEFLANENAPRCSAGQLNIVESESASHQTLQQEGDTHGIRLRE